MTIHGWHVQEIPSNPVTGRWIATRFGVEMCANTEAQILRMVEYKTEQERAERAARQRAQS